MPTATTRSAKEPELIGLTREATAVLDAVLADATVRVRERISSKGRADSTSFDREQRATHGLAWLATYAEAIRQLAAYAQRMQEAGRLRELEALAARIGIGEYLAQAIGGIPISQGEIVRPTDLGLTSAQVAARVTPNIERLLAESNNARNRARLIELMRGGGSLVLDHGLDDTLEAIREEMRKFTESEVVPHAHAWHLSNQYIPLEIIAHMAELGVFGLTIPEEYGGMGLGKESMCVVSEELSRGYIGVGSLGTRSEIAAELILGGGTEE